MGFRNTLLAIAAFGILVALVFAARIVEGDGPWGVIYGDASRAEEMVFLDDLAIYLEQHPEMVAHIVYFSSEKHSARQMKARTDRAVKYLTKRRKVDSKRLIVMYGGDNELSKIMLQPLPYKLWPSSTDVPTRKIPSTRNPSNKQ